MFNEDIKFQLPKHGQCSIFGMIGSLIGAGKAQAGLEDAMEMYDETADKIAAELEEASKKSKRRVKKEYGRMFRAFEPYRELGLNLLDRYEETLTPGSKWYEWRREEGEKGVRRWLASQGLSDSGEAATEAFQRMNTQLSAEEEQNVHNRLLGGLNLGYGATQAKTALRERKAGNLVSLYGSRAANLGNLYQWLAEKKAPLRQEQGYQQGSLYSNIGNTLDMGLLTAYGMGAFKGTPKVPQSGVMI